MTSVVTEVQKNLPPQIAKIFGDDPSRNSSKNSLPQLRFIASCLKVFEVKLMLDKLLAFKTERSAIYDYSCALQRGWLYPWVTPSDASISKPAA
jgi:hypothetical protein